MKLTDTARVAAAIKRPRIPESWAEFSADFISRQRFLIILIIGYE
jgi:hypothetical protein